MEEHARQAKEASKRNLREDFLEMGRRLLRLAHGYRFAQQRTRFGKTVLARSRNQPRVVMREIVIVAVACFLIGIMASALIVQLVP